MKTILSAKWTLLKMLSAALLAVALIPSAAHADDYFLKFTGPNIDGESKDKVHGATKSIDIYSFSWGASNSGSFMSGGGGGSGKVSFQDFYWSQGLDKSFTALSSYLATGQLFDKAVVTLRSSGSNPFEYLTMTFEEVLLTSLNFSGSSGGGRPDVQGSFAYEKIKFEYFKQDKSGQRSPDGEFTFNLGNIAQASGASLPESAPLQAIPEPETYAMLIAGLGLLGLIARRRQRVGTA